jgi:hypothetical protein
MHGEFSERAPLAVGASQCFIPCDLEATIYRQYGLRFESKFIIEVLYSG